MRISLLILSLLSLTLFANAQPGTTVIHGTVTEKKNLELSIVKTVNKKTEQLAAYKVFEDSPDFAFAVPAENGASYKLIITVMKQGHRRLEADKGASFPLQLHAGQNLSMKITPSALDEAKKKGMEVRNSSGYADVSFVSGNLLNSAYGGPISLQRVVDGNLVKVAEFNTSKTNKRFQLAIPIKEDGFYYVSSLRLRCRVYLKPADNVELSIDGYSGQYEIINGSEENRLVEKWHKLTWAITEYGYNRVIFQNDSLDLQKYFTTYQKLQPAIADFKIASKLSNEHFNHLFELAMDVDKEFAPLYLWQCLSNKRNNKFVSSFNAINELPPFYVQFFQPEKFKDAKILEIGEGMNYINLYQKLSFAFTDVTEGTKLGREEKLRIMMDLIKNDTLKAYFLKDQMETNEVNNLSEFRSTYQPFEKYTFPPNVKKTYQKVYESFIGDTAYLGKSSYNFSLSDTSGKAVSMKDFKGKVIFIDAWATWCGPCREQLPFLKEIEEEYRDNKDIVFMGISIDRLQDKQKWIRFIQKEKLSGVQLLDGSKAFRERYGVSSVPRFLLIDKQGKWIEVRCPRPEAKEELKRYLNSALQDNGLTNNN